MNPETNKFEPVEPVTIEARRKADRKPTKHQTAMINTVHEHESGVRSYIDNAGIVRMQRADGSIVPDNWAQFTIEEEILLKGHVFKVAYIGEDSMVIVPICSFKQRKQQRKETKQHGSALRKRQREITKS